MSWQAEAGSLSIGKGHVLTILFTPHVDGHPPPQIKVGDEISVNFANNARTKITVVDVSGSAVSVVTPEGSRWMLSLRTDSDPPFGGVGTGSIPSQDWIVRNTV
jgi:hypothetical protein